MEGGNLTWSDGHRISEECLSALLARGLIACDHATLVYLCDNARNDNVNGNGNSACSLSTGIKANQNLPNCPGV
jgi:hypothetical protein